MASSRFIQTVSLPHVLLILLAGLAASFALHCASSTQFVSSWRSPTAQSLHFKGANVVAVVMMRNESSRREAEDTLANEISARGAHGIPMYKLESDGSAEAEAAARNALEGAEVQGLVVMRPVGVKSDAVATPVVYTGPQYDEYWGGYYSYGWSAPYAIDATGNQTSPTVTVSVETLIYSLKQNQLVWGGQSKTTNPENVKQLISELASATADELKKLDLIAK
jgi:hypothetical protein